MAIDTASKRGSVLGVVFASTLLIVPDSTIAQGDRQTIANIYSGILADAPIIITPDCINQYTGIIDDTNTFATGFIGADIFQFQSKIVDYIQLEGNLCC